MPYHRKPDDICGGDRGFSTSLASPPSGLYFDVSAAATYQNPPAPHVRGTGFGRRLALEHRRLAESRMQLT